MSLQMSEQRTQANERTLGRNFLGSFVSSFEICMTPGGTGLNEVPDLEMLSEQETQIMVDDLEKRWGDPVKIP